MKISVKNKSLVFVYSVCILAICVASVNGEIETLGEKRMCMFVAFLLGMAITNNLVVNKDR